ncbi:hypothetical protein [Mesobacillus zeae]|uniref:hypothetical protein n=1 Tax=Mesobacillus zeae TaxID=1917180 RepID=UPI00300866B4
MSKPLDIDAIISRVAYVVDNTEWQSTIVSDLVEEDIPALLAEVKRLRDEISFIANVDMVSGAYDVDHVAVSVKCWALRALEGVNHDGK